MAEFIEKTDTLNQGREKLNSAIKDAEDAKNISVEADEKATQALANSESTQTQLDTIVIEGDSSVEAAQARVDAKGNPYTTLKERLDSEHTQVTQQLAQTTSKIFNVEWYGADNEGYEDSSDVIQQAINDAHQAGGGVVYFPRGTYLVEKTKVQVPELYGHVWEIPSNVKIFGDNAKIIGGEKSNYSVFLIGKNNPSMLTENVKITGLTIDGENIDSEFGITSAIVIRSYVKNVLIEGNTILNMQGTGINSQVSPSQYNPVAEDVRIINNYIDRCKGHGIASTAINNQIVVNNTVKNCYGASFGGYGINISEGHKRVLVSNNIVINCSEGIKAESIPNIGYPSENTILSQNIITGGANSTGHGIRISSENMIVVNNRISGHKVYGINLYGGDNTKAIISENIISNIEGNPFRIHHEGSNSNFIERDSILVLNNIFESCTNYGEVSSSGVTIRGNTFHDIDSYAIRVRNSVTSSQDKVFDNIIIKSNKIYDCLGGIDVQEKNNVYAENYDISDNNIYDIRTAEAIRVRSVKGLSLNDNKIDCENNDGIILSNCFDFTLNNNRSKNTVHRNIGLTLCNFGVVSGNMTSGGTVAISTAANAHEKLLVANNVDNGSTQGYVLHESVIQSNNI